MTAPKVLTFALGIVGLCTAAALLQDGISDALGGALALASLGLIVIGGRDWL